MANKNFVVQNGLTVGAVSIDATSGNITTSGTIVVTGSSPASFTSINNTPIGNVTPSSGAFTTISTTSDVNVGGNLVVTGTTTFNGGTLTLGDAATDNVVFGADVNSSIIPNTDAAYNLGSVGQQWNNLYLTGTASIDTLAVDENATVTGTLGVSGTTTLTGATTLTTATAGGIQAVAIGNVTPGTGAFTTSTTGGLQAVAIGNVTPGTGAFTTLSASGQLTSTVSTGTAPLVISSTTKVANLNVEQVDGYHADTSNTVSTIAVRDSSGIITASGFTGAVGSISPTTGAFTTVSASGVVSISNNSATTAVSNGALAVTGGVGIGGDLRVGGTIFVSNLQATSSTQITVQDPMLYLVSNVLYPYNYDIGVYSDYIGGPANTYVHSGAVRNYASNYWGFFSNVKSEPGSTVNWADAGLIWDTVKSGDHIVANSTASTSTTTGALTVAGGAGIAGAAYVGGRTTTAGVTTSSTILASTNNSIDIGASGTTFATVYATTFSGVSTTAKYADLAENYQADSNYQPGQVLMFGGPQEVTIASADTTAVAGVVSTNPAHLMNGALKGNNVVALALTGRVPCNVVGPVKKGDLLVSAGFGYAKVNNTPAPGTIIGKSLADFTGAKGQIEVVVGRF